MEEEGKWSIKRLSGQKKIVTTEVIHRCWARHCICSEVMTSRTRAVILMPLMKHSLCFLEQQNVKRVKNHRITQLFCMNWELRWQPV